MKRSAASKTPAVTETVMSKTTVSVKHVRSTATSLRGATRSKCAKCCESLMFQATTSRSAAREAMGR